LKGDVIYNESEPTRFWYEVVEGVVRTCRFHSDGHRQLTGFFYPGDVFGLDDGRHSEAAEAVTEATILRHQRQSANGGGGPEACPENALRRALASARRSIFLFGRRTAEERVAAFLLMLAERTDSLGSCALPMSRTDIADHIGLTIHTVSRTICELARRRLVALEGAHAFRVLDPAGLRELAGDPDVEEAGGDFLIFG
jgi:CRP-like cAMP-binding protein